MGFVYSYASLSYAEGAEQAVDHIGRSVFAEKRRGPVHCFAAERGLAFKFGNLFARPDKSEQRVGE